jgi:hypothetical protein
MSEATKPTIKFEFTIEQVNSILQALGKAPAEFALNPIMLIQNAAGPQVEELMAKKAEENKDEQ